MEFDKDLEKPSWLSGWYCQVLFEYIYEFDCHAGAVPDVLGKLVKHFRVKIDPLLKVAGQDFSIEEYGGNKELFEKVRKANQSCWQRPQKLIDCLRVFVDKIDNEPSVFSQLEIQDEYFLQGYFKNELLDLIRMAEWAKENGVKKIRLWAA
jgi:hypothetical protein